MKRLILTALLGLLLPVSAFGQFGDTPADQQVRGWYEHFLHRNVDAGAAFWVDPLKAGQSPPTVLSQILASTEYYIRGGSTDEGFVRQLYLDLTGRPSGPRETAFWVHRLAHSDRQQVAYSLLMRYPEGAGAGSPAPESDYPYDYRSYRGRPGYRP